MSATQWQQGFAVGVAAAAGLAIAGMAMSAAATAAREPAREPQLQHQEPQQEGHEDTKTNRRARRLARRAELAKSAKEAVDTAAATAAPAKQEAQDVDVDAAGQHGDHVVDAAGTTSTLFDSVGSADRILRKAETVLQRRTSRIIIVVEKCSLDHNHSAIIRTAEALGVQHLWLIDPPSAAAAAAARQKAWEADQAEKKKHAQFARMAQQWEDKRTIWVTDLSQQAECLTVDPAYGEDALRTIPERMAIVFGSETVGCSDTMLKQADKRVYLPLHGFADSLNLSVSTALVLQQLFIMAPDAVGDMPEAEKVVLRRAWYASLARDQDQLDQYMRRLDNPPAPFGDMRRADGHRTGWRRKTDKANMAHVADFRD
eukprot:gene8808-30550_t